MGAWGDDGCGTFVWRSISLVGDEMRAVARNVFRDDGGRGRYVESAGYQLIVDFPFFGVRRRL